MPLKSSNSPEILFLGNCQISRFQQFYSRFQDKPTKRFSEFNSITPHFGEFDEEKSMRTLETADIAVVQLILSDYVFNRENILSLRNGKDTIFVPYVYLPGFRRLEKVSSKGKPWIDGADVLLNAAKDIPPQKVLLNFQRGLIDGQNQKRFAESLDNLRTRESNGSSVFISDYIRNTYKSRLPCFSINHPTPHVLIELYNQVAKIAGFDKVIDQNMSEYDMGRATLPAGTGALSPYCVEALGLQYSHDSHWFSKESSIANIVLKRLQ